MPQNHHANLRTTCLAATAAAVLLAAAAAVPARASAPGAGGPAGAPRQPRHCVITLRGDDSPLTRCGAAARTRAARSGTLLMTWYADSGFTGDSTDIRDGAGLCDAAGYGISDIGAFLGPGWNNAISSFRTFNNCAVIQGFDGSAYGGDNHTWLGDQKYVGDEWNDRISSLLMHA